ncbi:endonuclease III domain-containing protein [uncultured Methanofollis sp.]|uniref:endonuclease III domain-containing protein n=1 Tax=uncultured Methanofollis sp. TaxID=262500 RepID=UPI0026090130|nr:Fe-S cluster assembly protein HesB [uncultured Methanofollis sp.]
MDPDERVRALLRGLAARYGEITWWDACPDEVVIGAVLTQQTRWENVERALARLREAGIGTVAGVDRAETATVEEAVRCTGFYRLKTARLKGLCRRILDMGGVEGLSRLPTPALREALLAVRGVGEETADSILCYGFGRPSFVVDAYTKRICGCVGVTGSYTDLKAAFERVLPEDAGEYGRAHGRVVEYAKEFCVSGRCDECRMKTVCV